MSDQHEIHIIDGELEDVSTNDLRLVRHTGDDGELLQTGEPTLTPEEVRRLLSIARAEHDRANHFELGVLKIIEQLDREIEANDIQSARRQQESARRHRETEEAYEASKASILESFQRKEAERIASESSQLLASEEKTRIKALDLDSKKSLEIDSGDTKETPHELTKEKRMLFSTLKIETETEIKQYKSGKKEGKDYKSSKFYLQDEEFGLDLKMTKKTAQRIIDYVNEVIDTSVEIIPQTTAPSIDLPSVPEIDWRLLYCDIPPNSGDGSTFTVNEKLMIEKAQLQNTINSMMNKMAALEKELEEAKRLPVIKEESVPGEKEVPDRELVAEEVDFVVKRDPKIVDYAISITEEIDWGWSPDKEGLLKMLELNPVVRKWEVSDVCFLLLAAREGETGVERFLSDEENKFLNVFAQTEGTMVFEDDDEDEVTYQEQHFFSELANQDYTVKLDSCGNVELIDSDGQTVAEDYDIKDITTAVKWGHNVIEDSFEGDSWED